MKKTLIALGTLLAVTQIASAQTPNAPNPPANSNAAPQANTNIRQQMQNDLQTAGFSDVKVMPESFLVRAKDKSGNPVMMVINPDSISEVTTLRSNGASQPNATGQTFINLSQQDKLSSNLVGLDVYNRDSKDIGTIKDVAVNRDGVQAYVLSVGGFLGMGEHYVAVNPAMVNVTYNAGDKKWHATMNATADQLKAAPEFKYTGEWSASHS